jgi:hypothetical protein
MRALLVRACSPMNKLYVGFKKSIDLPKGGFLFIDDEARNIPRSLASAMSRCACAGYSLQ